MRFSFTRPCDPLSVTMPPQLFVLVCSSRLMLELYNERFRGRKLLSCLAFPFINHRLTDLLSLQTAPPPPPFPKALPVQRRATLALPSLGRAFPSLTQAVSAGSGAQQGTARRQILHLPFHSEYTQRAESRHAASESHTSPGEDWLLAVVTTRMQAR